MLIRSQTGTALACRFFDRGDKNKFRIEWERALTRNLLFLRIILFFSLVLGSVGCQRAEDNVNPAVKEVSLFHYLSFTGTMLGTMDGITTEINRQSSAYVLKQTPLDHESFKTSIRDDLRLGNTADIYTYWAGARTRSIIDQLTPIDDALPLEEMNKLFGSTVVQSACFYNGHIYLVPVTQHLVGFFYNKKIFAENGLVPPTNWDEFLAIGEKLKARKIVPVALGSKAKWPAQFWFDYLLLRTAPVAYRNKLLAGEGAFTDPEVRRVFSLWHDLIKGEFFNPHPNELEIDSGAAMMVRNGEAAMTLMGTWLIGYFNGMAPAWNEGSDYGFFPFPTIDPKIPSVALGPIDGLVVPKSAHNMAGAKAVLKFFASSPVQEALSRGTGSLAPNRQLPSNLAYSPLKNAIRNEIAQSSVWAFNYDLATSPENAEIGLNLFAEFIEFPDQYMMLLDKAEKRMKQVASGVDLLQPFK